nr:hypothetical protein HK105_007702 [Polyrhizophydium stewartii]
MSETAAGSAPAHGPAPQQHQQHQQHQQRQQQQHRHHMARVHDHQELHALQVQQLQSADPRSVAGAGGDAAGPATPSRGSPTPAASSAGGADAAPSSPSDQRDLTSDLAPLVKATVSRWTEFKVFILSTHTLDTGVGVIIGRALQDLLRSFVNDVLIPPLGLVVVVMLSSPSLALWPSNIASVMALVSAALVSASCMRCIQRSLAGAVSWGLVACQSNAALRSPSSPSPRLPLVPPPPPPQPLSDSCCG